jgi:hypothetical protein
MRNKHKKVVSREKHAAAKRLYDQLGDAVWTKGRGAPAAARTGGQYAYY